MSFGIVGCLFLSSYRYYTINHTITLDITHDILLHNILSPNFKDLFNSMVTLVIHGYLKPNDLRTELEKSPETQFISLYSLIYTFAGEFSEAYKFKLHFKLN